MRFGLILPLAIVIYCLPADGQAQPRRDLQAKDVFARAVNIGGGFEAIRGIQDYRSSGAITYFWADEEVHGTVTMRGRGLRQFRLDANLPSGERSWTVSDEAGSSRDSEGNTTAIPYHNGANLGNLTFPLAQIAAALHESPVTIEYTGLATKGDRQVHHIRTYETPAGASEADDSGAVAKRLTLREYFIDVLTFQVVCRTDMVYAQRDPTNGHPRELFFSDYRPVNGVLVPFSITETVAGQRTWTIQVNQFDFNLGLQDADFELSGGH